MRETAIAIDRRGFPDRRMFRERRVFNDRRTCEERNEIEALNEGRKLPSLVKYVCLISITAIGVAMYMTTGLYSAVDSIIGHIIVGGGILYGYLAAFTRGLSSR